MSNPIFSYTHRDYEGSRKEGLAQIPIISQGKYTDLNATDPGIIILDYVHALCDMMQYYQDHQALESFITTAKERANIFRLAKQLSYDIRSAKGATCVVTFDSPMLYSKTVKIPRYTAILTLDDISYLTTQDEYLLPGEHLLQIPCVQGKKKEIQYVGTGISRFSSVAGATNQSIRLVDTNIDIDSVEIVDSLGRSWTPVDYIVFATGEQRAYQTELNPDDSITIHFGDGERGRIPKNTDILIISYVSSLAEDGRVPANSLVRIPDPILDETGDRLLFNVYNAQASTGGSRSQTSREIRELAPGVIKTQNRAVTLKDFESLAKMVEGVADAKAYDINTRPHLCLYHEVKVLITPTDAESSMELLNKRVYDYLSSRMIPPTNLQVLTPSVIPLNISVVVRRLDTTTEGRLTYLVQRAIEDYFAERIGAIEEPFYPADLSAVLSRLEGIRYVVSITPNNVVSVAELSTLSLGTLDITVQ